MTAGFCARLLGMYPCRLSKKIIAFCSGCGWILPVILIAIAALPGFCQQYVHREITLCVGRHTSITIPLPRRS